MTTEIGRIEGIFRYPVKSMAGEPLRSAEIGWHGLEGDRRLALRRLQDRGGFPFLTASKLPRMILYAPKTLQPSDSGLPSHVRTPDGRELPIFGEELADELGRLHESPLQMMHLRHGIFDDGSISVIATSTIEGISRLAGQHPDVRRFRPNIVVRSLRTETFHEDAWVGGVLTFGSGPDAPSVAVTQRDLRCAMLNIDPDTAAIATGMMKAVVRANENNAGVYGSVLKTGRIAMGQSIFLHPATGKLEHEAASAHR